MTHDSSHRFGLRSVLAVLIAVGAACVWYFSGNASQLEQARQAVQRDEKQSALRHYARHLHESPDDHAVRLELAEFLKPVDAGLALRHLQKIPQAAPEYPAAIWHIAHIAVVSGQDELAEESLLKLDKARPNDAAVALNLAELYFRTERFSDALPWVEQASSLQPDRAGTWLLLAEVLDRLKRTGEMLPPLKKAVELAPDLYAAHANLAYALQAAGQLQEAEAEARWCLDRQPTDVRVRRWLAMIRRDLGDLDDAMQQIRLATAEAPEDADCRMLEADLLLFQRQAEDAYQVLVPLYSACSGRRDYLSNLSRAAAMSGRRDEARRYQQEVVNLIDELSDQVNPVPTAGAEAAD
ncbi:MAG: tetratricopeptide repeat protein [Planctomycetaceae bacterium]